MGHNRAGVNRKKRIMKARKEKRRIEEKRIAEGCAGVETTNKILLMEHCMAIMDNWLYIT